AMIMTEAHPPRRVFSRRAPLFSSPPPIDTRSSHHPRTSTLLQKIERRRDHHRPSE
ncbi:hypothetical protein CEXT_642561, partial [Caerostris extrusa]